MRPAHGAGYGVDNRRRLPPERGEQERPRGHLERPEFQVDGIVGRSLDRHAEACLVGHAVDACGQGAEIRRRLSLALDLALERGDIGESGGQLAAKPARADRSGGVYAARRLTEPSHRLITDGEGLQRK